MAGDCAALWQLRTSNPQIPEAFVRQYNWHATNDTDTSCCSKARPWGGVSCDDSLQRITVLTLDLSPLPATQRPSVLPASFAQLTQVRSLQLVGWASATLPDVFSNWRLNHLEIIDVPLRALPASLGMPSITYIIIRSTAITDLMPICNMTNLQIVYVTDNQRLASIDCSFSKHLQLHIAVFSRNALSNFRAFDHCQNDFCDTWPGLELLLDANQVRLHDRFFSRSHHLFSLLCCPEVC